MISGHERGFEAQRVKKRRKSYTLSGLPSPLKEEKASMTTILAEQEMGCFTSNKNHPHRLVFFQLNFTLLHPAIAMLTVQIYRWGGGVWSLQPALLCSPGTVTAPGERDDGEQTANN